MQWVSIYREQGLGAFVRGFWESERIRPPVGHDTNQVWEWINRSDVAASIVLQLIPDPRFVLVVFTTMARKVVRFIGGVPLEALCAAELVVYGVDTELWPGVLQRTDTHRNEWLRSIAGKPSRETDWQTWALSAVMATTRAAEMIRQGAPAELTRNELAKIANSSWEALRRKYVDVDGFPHQTGKCLANAVLVSELRELVSPQQFGATFTWARQS